MPHSDGVTVSDQAFQAPSGPWDLEATMLLATIKSQEDALHIQVAICSISCIGHLGAEVRSIHTVSPGLPIMLVRPVTQVSSSFWKQGRQNKRRENGKGSS
uniref:Uncharacterized protein n=1 Tax=Opuntia streptacantha TaxID=393608 RepID=A0A7C9ENS7_OPUST